ARERLFALAGVAARAHAACVGVAILLVVLAGLVEAEERAAAGADQATDRRSLAGALAPVGDRSAGRTDRGTDHRADGGVLHDLGRLVLRTDLLSGLLVTALDDRAGRRRLRHALRRHRHPDGSRLQRLGLRRLGFPFQLAAGP